MIRVQGTELYMLDGSQLSKVACVSSISGLSESMSMRGRATLCDDVNFEEPAFPEYSQVAFNTRLSYDSAKLLEMQRQRKKVILIVGLGDSKEQPFMSGGELRMPGARSWIVVEGHYTSFGIGLAAGSVADTAISFNVTDTIDVIVKNLIPWSNGLTWSNGEYWR